MSILDKIQSSNDVKQLNTGELQPLCKEIRTELIGTVSRTGGHLASNLGAVELTVALHRVYDTSKDRIVFDVGHQSYTHKILTGRKDRFETLRQFDGISGFPKPGESIDDAFIAGHASNSVSVALGMAHARTRLGEDYDVCAVIGDGALTGGLSFEGLSDAAQSGEPIVIVLNDNKMSISENVGGTAKMLGSLRIKPGYLDFKRRYRKFFRRFPALYRFNHAVKEWLKAKLLPGNVFSELGFDYLGPVDGHDVTALERTIRLARDMRIPVVVHAVTQKGKGYSFAEKDPEKFHGVGPFDPLTGQLRSEDKGFAEQFGTTLTALADREPRICAITAAMAGGTGLSCFSERFPDRIYDIGIAEGHAAALAAGMAKQGLLPVFAVYSTFLQRAFDMLIHDISLQKLHVVLAVDRAGLVGRDGETHQGSFDVAYLSAVPDMTIFSPASYAELDAMLNTALFSCKGPVAIRYPRGGEGFYTDCHTEDETVLLSGSDVTLVGYGIMINEILSAADILQKQGVSAEVIKLGKLRPNLFEETALSVKKTGRLVVAEDVCAFGGIGEQLLASLTRSGLHFFSRSLSLGNGIVRQGSVEELRSFCGIDAQSIAKAALELSNG